MLTAHTSRPVLRAIPYRRDPVHQLRRLADLPWPALLDSAGAGRYDIIVADPLPGRGLSLGPAPDGAALGGFLEQLKALHAAQLRPTPDPSEPPFCGGLVGFIGYDAVMPLHGLRSRAPAGAAPSAQVHDYPLALVQDRQRQEACLVARPGFPPARLTGLERRLRAPIAAPTAAFSLTTPFTSNLDERAYGRAFTRARDYIHAGDVYQVNLAQRFSAGFAGDSLAAYERLRGRGRAPFSAYLPLGGDSALLALSPERFLALTGSRVLTQPIKGTRPRGATAAADQAIASALTASPKDRAENLMIVDLLRNDLGRRCRPGSIRVEELFALHSFPDVHHLVSTISGELAAEYCALDLLRACLPGGSITGAPKRRAMEIIDELEPHPRQAYCGSVFYLDDGGRMDSNILIRSFLAEGDHMHCWAGGGLVADSDAAAEYAETMDKVGGHLRRLEAPQ
jgi:para-aminobenzoate synthetase component 1